VIQNIEYAHQENWSSQLDLLHNFEENQFDMLKKEMEE